MNLYERYFESLTNPVLIINDIRRIISANRKAIETLKYSKKELREISIDDIIISDDTQKKKAKLLFPRSNKPISKPIFLRASDGTIVNAEAVIQKILGENSAEYTITWTEQTAAKRIPSSDEGVITSELLRTIIDLVPHFIFAKNIDGEFVLVNKAVADTYGVTVEQLIGKKDADFARSDAEVEHFRNDDLEVIHSGTPKIIPEEIITDSNGSVHLLTTTKIPFQMPDSDVQCVLGVSTDITEIREAYIALRESEAKHRIVLEESSDAIYALDPTGHYRYVNAALANYLGKTPAEIEGKTIANFFQPELASIRLAALKQAVDTGEVVTNEFADIRDGKENYLLCTLNPVKNEKGIVDSVIGVSKDITERKKTEIALRINEDRYRRIFDLSPVGITLQNEKCQIIEVNDAFCEMAGYHHSELIGQHISIVCAPEKIAVIEPHVKHLLSGERLDHEVINRRKDGTHCDVELRETSMLLSDGTLGIISIAKDITEQKKILGELIAAKEKAEEMNIIKSSFFAGMSHELRTPLIGILGYSEILQSELQNNQRLHHMATMIHRGGGRLLDTLNMVLTFSKLDFEAEQMYPSANNIIPLLQEAYELFLPVAQKKRLNLHFLHKGEAILCDVDIKFFRNIINNLINNAVKYTDVGKIWIEVKREINFAVIEVGDTGIGIPKAKQDIIWEEFRQGSEGKGRSFEGTGLGLSIARKCVQLMKGHISLRSEPGKGAVFTIRLPLAKTTTIHSPRTEPNETRAASASGKIKNVLLVEDDELSIDYITMILSGRAAVHPALNGEEALRMVHANKFDIILMDINLKRGLSGVEITERVRKISGYEKVPIVAVTAYAMSGDKEEFLSKGMTHYLSKPFSRKELFALMDQLETSK